MTGRRILIPYDGSDSAQEMLHLAGDLTSAAGGQVFVVGFSRVPPSLPLADLAPSFDQKLRQALVTAGELAHLHGWATEIRVRRSYDVPRAILSEARAVWADAIFLPIQPSSLHWNGLLLSREVRMVMRQAECLVVLVRSPRRRRLDSSHVLDEVNTILGRSPLDLE